MEGLSLKLWAAGLLGSPAFVILADGPGQELLEKPPGLAVFGRVLSLQQSQRPENRREKLPLIRPRVL